MDTDKPGEDKDKGVLPADDQAEQLVTADEPSSHTPGAQTKPIPHTTDTQPAINDDTLPDAFVAPHLPVASSPGEGTSTKRTFGQYLKRIRSAVSRASSGSAGNKARKTTQDVTANERAGPRAPSAASYLTNSRTTTPVELLGRLSGTNTPESMRLTTPSPDLALALRSSIYTNAGHNTTGYTPRSRTPEEWSKARRSNLAAMQAQAREANPSPDYTTSMSTSAVHGNTTPTSRTTSPTTFLSSRSRSFANLFSRSSSAAPRHLQDQESGMDVDDNTSPVNAAPAPEPYLTPTQRAEKMMKVRSHWHCHHCAFAMGSNHVCFICGHSRCKKCFKKSGRQTPRDVQPVQTSAVYKKQKEEVLMTNPEVDEKTFLLQQDASHSTPLQTPRRSVSPTIADIPRLLTRLTSAFCRDNSGTRRVRRLCHQCHNPFLGISRYCGGCDHTMCDKCPSDRPASPTRDSGRTTRRVKRTPTPQEQQREQEQKEPIKDRKLALPRYRIKYTCDKCGSKFDSSTKKCQSCGHRKCESCGRWPPREPQNAAAPVPLPSAVDTLEDTLAQYALKDEPRQFVDSGAASVFHDRVSVEQRSFSVDKGIGVEGVAGQEGNVVVPSPGGEEASSEVKKDTDMTDDH